MKTAIIAGLIACAIGTVAVSRGDAMTTAEQYGWYDGMIIGEETTYLGDGGGGACGTGQKTECGSKSTEVCLQWAITTAGAGGTISPTGSGVNSTVTKSCQVKEITTIKLFFP